MPLAPHEAPDSPPVTVEVVLLRHGPIEGFVHRRLIKAPGREASPDRAAKGLAPTGEHDSPNRTRSPAPPGRAALPHRTRRSATS